MPLVRLKSARHSSTWSAHSSWRVHDVHHRSRLVIRQGAHFDCQSSWRLNYQRTPWNVGAVTVRGWAYCSSLDVLLHHYDNLATLNGVNSPSVYNYYFISPTGKENTRLQRGMKCGSNIGNIVCTALRDVLKFCYWIGGRGQRFPRFHSWAHGSLLLLMLVAWFNVKVIGVFGEVMLAKAVSLYLLTGYMGDNNLVFGPRRYPWQCRMTQPLYACHLNHASVKTSWST